MRRQTAAKLPVRGSQCAAHPCSKVVGAQSLGHPACEAKRAAQSQGCRRSKTCCHSAPNVDRRDRVQLVDEEGRRVTRNKEITEFPHGREKTSCRDDGGGEIAPGFAMLKRAKRASH